MATNDNARSIILTVTADIDKAIKNIAEARAQVDELRKKQKELDTTTEDGRQQYELYAMQIRTINTNMRQYQREVDNTVRAQNAEKGSLTQLKAELSKLTAQYNDLSEAERNSELGQNLVSQINEITDTLNAGEQAIQNYRRQVGNYQQAILGTIAGNNSFVASILSTATGAGGATGVFKALSTQVMAFGKALLSLLANPIVLLIAAIVAAVVLLYKAFQRSEENMNKVNVVIAKVSGAFNGLLKILEPVASFLVDVLIKAFDDLVEAIEFCIEKTAELMDFLGFDGAAEGIRSVASEMKEMAAQAKILAEAENELSKAERETQKIQLDYQRKAERLRQIRDDDTKSIQERIKANNDLGAVLKEQLQQELRIAQQALAVANLRLIIEGNTATNLDAQAEALTRIADIQERITGQESEQLQNNNALRRSGADKAYENAQKNLQNTLEINRAKIQAEGNYQSEDFKLKQQYSKRVFDLEQANAKALLDLQVKHGKITKAEYAAQLTILGLQLQEFSNTQVKETNAYFIQQKDAIISMLEQSVDEQINATKDKYAKAITALGNMQMPTRLDGQTDEQYEIELRKYEAFQFEKGNTQMRLEKQMQKELEDINYNSIAKRAKDIEEALDKQYEGDIAKFLDNEREKNKLEIQLMRDQIEAKKEAGLQTYADEAALRSLIAQEAQIALDSELINANENARAKYEANKKYLESLLAIYKGNADEQAKIQKQIADNEKKHILERIDTYQRYAEAAMEVLGGLNTVLTNMEAADIQRAEEDRDQKVAMLDEQLARNQISQEEYNKQVQDLDAEMDKKKAEAARKQAIREKAMKVFSVVTDTAVGIAKAVASSPLTFGLPWSAFMAASGALQLAAIASEPIPKAAKGMKIGGKSHLQGGETIEVENGEVVINKKSAAMYMPLLSKINEAGGGIPFTKPLSDGGYAVRAISSSNNATANDIATAVKDALAGVNIVTTVEDIRKENQNYVNIENRANY